MKRLVFASALALSSLNVAADWPPAGSAPGPNPVADPFNANARPEPPPPSPLKPTGGELPAAPAFLKNAQPLPPSLRVMLIRANGRGLLGSGEAGAFSIAVADGKPVRIAGQNYLAEVTESEVKLYSSPKKELIWEGSLAGSAPTSIQADASQAKYVPPLSAGVNPGLKPVTSSSGTTAGQPLTKVSGSP